MSPRKSPSRPLGRRVEVRPERRIVKVFTEGKGSEPDYLRGLAKLYLDTNSFNFVVSDKHGVPRTLVDLAKRCRKDEEIDDVWCVFDVECPQPHPLLREACQSAADAGIGVAVSNPCFEYWLTIHFMDFAKPETTDDMESISRRLDGRANKRITFEQHYADHVEEACDRARRQHRSHQSAGTLFPRDNPSTSVYKLVDFLRSLSTL